MCESLGGYKLLHRVYFLVCELRRCSFKAERQVDNLWCLTQSRIADTILMRVRLSLTRVFWKSNGNSLRMVSIRIRKARSLFNSSSRNRILSWWIDSIFSQEYDFALFTQCWALVRGILRCGKRKIFPVRAISFFNADMPDCSLLLPRAFDRIGCCRVLVRASCKRKFREQWTGGLYHRHKGS